MKKIIYISGIISVGIILIGTLLKMNHIAGAGITFTLGMLLLCVVFLPLAVINSYKADKSRKWLYIALFISVFIDLIGALFKVMHWPFAQTLLVIGLPLPFILFLPVFMYYSSKEKTITKTAVVAFFMVYLAVISSLLALNASREIIDDNIRVNRMMQQSIEVYKAVKVDVIRNVDIDKKTDLQKFTTKTDSLCAYLQNMRKELALAVDEKNAMAIHQGKINYMKLQQKDNTTVAGRFLYSAKTNKATELQSRLNAYLAYLNSSDIAEHEEIKQLLNKLKTLNGNEPLNAVFAKMPFISILGILTSIEQQIRMLESQVLWANT